MRARASSSSRLPRLRYAGVRRDLADRIKVGSLAFRQPKSGFQNRDRGLDHYVASSDVAFRPQIQARAVVHSVFDTQFASWRAAELAIAALPTTQERGDAFEELVHFYFSYHAALYQIAELYCPIADGRSFPRAVTERLRLEQKDHGVDGAFITTDGRCIAFQAKFRSRDQRLLYRELATFWTEAEYADGRIVVSNVTSLPTLAGKKAGHSAILLDVLENLDERFFEALRRHAKDAGAKIEHPRKTPRPYQAKILDSLETGLSTHSRGKLIAACGIGKTLIALWLTEARGDQTILFLAPSLQLIRQTLGEWANEAALPFEYLCVCSDASVDLEDEPEIAISELDVPVTTQPTEIADFLSNTSKHRKIIFSTYQSVPVIVDAIKASGSPGFDIAFYDEAHRTAGVSGSSLFSLAVSDAAIPARAKLFMTATERLVKPRLRGIAERAQQVVFSMDDERLYGPTLYRLSFGDAIKQGIVSDYRIVFAGITEADLAGLIERNRYVTTESPKEVDAAREIYKRVLLKRCIDELGIRKTVSFHGKVADAYAFATELDAMLPLDDYGPKAIDHVNGTMSSGQRTAIIREFENADLGVLTNVRCLTEGVDIPLIDAVYFASPRTSMIDIVQAVGRALRQPYGQKGQIAYIIVPVLLDHESGDPIAGDAYDGLFGVIQALRDQDETLAEWIDHLNLGAVTGRKEKGSRIGKLELIVPPDFDIERLEGALLLRIAEVNRNPLDHVEMGSKLGKGERTSSYPRLFKTLGDYAPLTLKQSLIDPTLERIDDISRVYSGSELKVNNNNVSHAERLGLIKKVSGRSYEVTDVGVMAKSCEVTFESLFKNQMLLFSHNTGSGLLYPYREAMRYLLDLGRMDFYDFLYGLFSIQMGDDGQPALEKAIAAGRHVRATYPNIELTSAANREKVRGELNARHPVGFSEKEVWTDRTTIFNQYRYFIRHLELFDRWFDTDVRKIALTEEGARRIPECLDETEEMLDEDGYGYHWWLTKP